MYYFVHSEGFSPVYYFEKSDAETLVKWGESKGIKLFVSEKTDNEANKYIFRSMINRGMGIYNGIATLPGVHGY